MNLPEMFKHNLAMLSKSWKNFYLLLCLNTYSILSSVKRFGYGQF